MWDCKKQGEDVLMHAVVDTIYWGFLSPQSPRDTLEQGRLRAACRITRRVGSPVV